MSSIRWSSRPLVVKPTRTKMRMKTKTRTMTRSEEHTSELQSHSDIVCRLLLEKKKMMVHHSELKYDQATACVSMRAQELNAVGNSAGVTDASETQCMDSSDPPG